MDKTPKSLRVQIGIFGRTNVGKSTFLNYISNQDVAITSPVAGTTTDVVEKTMELLPLGPVVFLDTAGIDDASELSSKRLDKSRKIFDRSDLVLLVIEGHIWGEFEEIICKEAAARKVPLIIIINKTDRHDLLSEVREQVKTKTDFYIQTSCLNNKQRDDVLNDLKSALERLAPDSFLKTPLLIGDLLGAGKMAVFIVPIDLQAPKGRLILPQVQAIRDVLDNDAAVIVVKEREYTAVLDNLKTPPDIVVCDSQVVLKMMADTPAHVKCTTFSILFARFKGDLVEMARGAGALERLQPKDKILIAESCSHHAIEDDIGRVKIPRWLRQYVGADLDIDVYSGRDFPDNLSQYKCIIHCGSCMLTRRELGVRILKAKKAGVPITNYGLCISLTQGVLQRALEPFPAALEAFRGTI